MKTWITIHWEVSKKFSETSTSFANAYPVVNFTYLIHVSATMMNALFGKMRHIQSVCKTTVELAPSIT